MQGAVHHLARRADRRRHLRLRLRAGVVQQRPSEAADDWAEGEVFHDLRQVTVALREDRERPRGERGRRAQRRWKSPIGRA